MTSSKYPQKMSKDFSPILTHGIIKEESLHCSKNEKQQFYVKGSYFFSLG
jgi:hypothetical protein